MFSENLKIARKRKDYTLEQLANEYNKRFGGGLSKGTLSKYENGKQEPMITVVINLAEILDVSIDFLTNSTLDNTYKLVSDELGLSQKSIEIIKTLNDNNLSDAINCLIEDNNFVDFLQYFYQYKTEFADRKTAEKYFNKFISKIGHYARAIYPVDNVEDYEYLIYNNLQRHFDDLVNRLYFKENKQGD